MTIDDIINQRHPLPPASMERLKSCLDEVECPRGTLLIEAGRVERNVYFLLHGIARAYVLADGREVTFWIGREGDALFSMNGYVADKPGYEWLELMEDSRLCVLKRDALRRLFATDVHIANWGRRYAESELLATEQRLLPLLHATATQRYRDLLEHDPELLRRLPLGSIASYLGVTQASLSRIRAEMGGKRGKQHEETGCTETDDPARQDRPSGTRQSGQLPSQ